MLENLLLALGGIGLLTVFIGRHMMIRDTGGDVPILWMVALRLIPFSELVYMVRHYALAKTGGIVSIVGMWLMVPYAGAQLWEEQTRMKHKMEQYQHNARGRAEKADEDKDDFSEMSAEGASYFLQARTHHLLEKQKKVGQINARLAWWHQQLQQRRAALEGADEPTIRAFNADAAAYSTFNALAKDENAELAKLQDKR